MPKIFITISPPPRDRNNYSIIQFQYLEDILFIRQCFGKLRRWIIYPELDKKGRLHYHGIVSLSNHDHVTWYRSVKPKLQKLGYIDHSTIDNIKENLRCLLYCQKDFHITKDILGLKEPALGFTKRKTDSSIEVDNNFIDRLTLEHYGFKLEQ